MANITMVEKVMAKVNRYNPDRKRLKIVVLDDGGYPELVNQEAADIVVAPSHYEALSAMQGRILVPMSDIWKTVLNQLITGPSFKEYDSYEIVYESKYLKKLEEEQREQK